MVGALEQAIFDSIASGSITLPELMRSCKNTQTLIKQTLLESPWPDSLLDSSLHHAYNTYVDTVDIEFFKNTYSLQDNQVGMILLCNPENAHLVDTIAARVYFGLRHHILSLAEMVHRYRDINNLGNVQACGHKWHLTDGGATRYFNENQQFIRKYKPAIHGTFSKPIDKEKRHLAILQYNVDRFQTAGHYTNENPAILVEFFNHLEGFSLSRAVVKSGLEFSYAQRILSDYLRFLNSAPTRAVLPRQQ